MSRKRFDTMNCAAAQALEQIGDWWTLLIVRESFYGATTFTEFQQRLGIARNILTNRLAHLTANGILTREKNRPESERYRYGLTEKGEALLPVLVALMQWGDRFIFNGEGPLKLLDSRDQKPIRTIRIQSWDDRALTFPELRLCPGKSADETTLQRFKKKSPPIPPPG